LSLIELVEAALLVGALTKRLEEAVPCKAESYLQGSSEGGGDRESERADEDPS